MAVKEKRKLRKLIGGGMQRYALLMGAIIMPYKEEYVLSMERRSNYVAVKGVQSILRKEESVLSKGQRSITKSAVSKDAQTDQRKEEYALSMGQR